MYGLRSQWPKPRIRHGRLADEAEKRGKVLYVDHTFIYTSAVQKIAEIIRSGELGRLYYYDSTRINLGLFQRDVSVISDLAVHDFSILQYILGEHPLAVSASGTNHFPGTPENLAYITLFYEFRNHCAHQRELAGARKGAPNPDWRQQEDDRLRRPRTKRKNQGLR